MKEIHEQDIECVKAELSAKRQEFEKLEFSSFEEKLEWIRDFFYDYVLELKKRYMTEKELAQKRVGLPDEVRVQFYVYFPEHGLNMDNYSQELAYELDQIRRRRRRRKQKPSECADVFKKIRRELIQTAVF